MHISTAGEIARASQRDGADTPSLLHFGELTKDEHAERNLHRWTRGMHKLNLQPSYTELELDVDGKLKPERVRLPCFNVWEVFEAIYMAGPLQFAVSMVGRGGGASLLNYWQHAKRCKWGQQHPAVQNCSDIELMTLIPMHVHSDGTEI